MTFIPMLIQAAAAVGSAYLTSRGNAKQETKNQKTQRKLIDELLASISGQGQYSDLFNMDEEAFKKAYVDPAKSMFNNQIAPQIQQQYIATGQQQGSGLQDTLTRAGVDLDMLLNQQYYQFQQDAKNRQQNLIGSIIGMGAGAPNQPTTGQNIMSGIGGYIGSESFGNEAAKIYNTYFQRKGFDGVASGAAGAPL